MNRILLLATVAGLPTVELFQRTVIWGFSRFNRDPQVLEVVRDMVARAHRPTMLGLCRELVALDLTAELGRLEVPTLVIGGTRDLLAPASHARRLAAGIRGAELRIFDGASHLICISRAESFNEALCGFIARAEMGAGPDRLPSGHEETRS